MKTNSAKYIATAFSLMIMVLLVLPFGAHALSNTYTPLAPLPDLKTLQPVKSVNISDYIQYMFNLLIAVGAVAAVFEITWGGFEYMTSDAVSGKSAGVEKIKNAIYGLLLVLSSYLILKTIDPRLVNIPSSLVDPIQSCTKGQTTGCVNTSYDSNSVGAGSLKEINTLNANQATLRDTLASSTNQLNNLNNQTLSIADQITAITGKDAATSCVDSENSSNTQLKTLCQQYNSNKDSANTLQSSNDLLTAKGSIDNAVGVCGTTGDANCYATQKQVIASKYSEYSGKLQPNDLTTLKNYADAAQITLSMDQYVSDYNTQLAAYNLVEFGSGGTVNSVASTIVRYTGGAIGGTNAVNYRNIQLSQTQAISGIESQVKNAKSTITDQDMLSTLESTASSLKNQISSNSPRSPY